MSSDTAVERSGERWQEKPFRTGGVLLVSFCHFIHDVYSSFLSPLLPLLIEKFSLSLARAGLLSTVLQLPAILNPLIGIWADRISVRWFIILAPSMTALPMSLIGLAPSYAMLLIMLFITGISVSLFHVPSPVMVAKLSGDYKGRGMALYMTGGELARAIGPLVAVGAVSLLGLEGYYPIMVFGLAASFWLFLKFKDENIRQKSRHTVSLKGTWRQVGHVMRPLIGILCARGFMHAAVTTFLPTYIASRTGNLWLAGISLTLVEGAGVAGVLAAGSLSDKLGRRRMLLLSLVTAPFMLLGFVWLDGWLRYAMLIFTGLTLLSTTPVMLALVQEHSSSSPAAANGILMMALFLARSSIVVIVGLMGDAIGLEATYICCSVLGMVSIPFIMMLPSDRARRSK
ncbi:MAG: MFS transporter [Desulfobacteraceae bacterium]|jgi:FSR family fosmidomycin resistance protein-like MFS transporter